MAMAQFPAEEVKRWAKRAQLKYEQRLEEEVNLLPGNQRSRDTVLLRKARTLEGLAYRTLQLGERLVFCDPDEVEILWTGAR